MQKFSRPPTAASSAIETTPSLEVKQPRRKKIAGGMVALLVGGIAMTVALLGFAIFIRVKRTRTKVPQEEDGSNMSMYSIPDSSAGGENSANKFNQ